MTLNLINKASTVKRVVLMLLIVVLSLLAFKEQIALLISKWNGSQDFNYGYIIPVITLYLIWQKRSELLLLHCKESWIGVVIIISSAFTLYIGKLSAIQVIELYSIIFAIYGIVILIVGWRGFREIIVPLLILFFMVPLPQFILANMSSELQLISSRIGVALIRLLGISVYLEGNVIDIGYYKLQVVEACSGLRYLFPLLVFGFILSYLFKAALWKRSIVFLSAIPITIIMNSVRIGMIGITVEYWGEEMADGFLHDFEGWFIFILSTMILIIEMWILNRINNNGKRLADVFGVINNNNKKTTSNEINKSKMNRISVSQLSGIFALVLILLTTPYINELQEITPERITFDQFPDKFVGWTGRIDKLKSIYTDALKMTDYALLDYVNNSGEMINFYASYYQSQRSGASAHSPRTCLPGGGWKMSNLETLELKNIKIDGHKLTVNRAIIQLRGEKQLVYYWFQQRGRVLNNEYVVKWYLFWDGLTRNRTDGALVRLITPVGARENIEKADERMRDYISKMAPYLTSYIPS
jgi:exosortase D (VPLPA-CTERM-specific)